MNQMKKVFAAVSAVMMLTAAGCAKTANEGAPAEAGAQTGAWEKVSDGTITPELEELFEKAMASKIGVTYKPIELLETQLVSGKNYKFLCEATAAALGAETRQAIVTIYEDLQGNVEVLDIEDVEPEGNASVQIPNPFVNAATIEEAVGGAGFDFTIPEAAEGYEISSISYIPDNMIQVIYGEDDNAVYVRKAKGSEDISGDYNTYTDVETVTVDGREVTLSGKGDGVSNAVWTDGDYSYAVIARTPLERAIAEKMISEAQ